MTGARPRHLRLVGRCRRTRTLLGAVLVAGLIGGPVADLGGLAPAVAVASPLTDARNRAADLAAQLRHLENDSEAAAERYAAATGELGAAQSRFQAGAQQLDATRAALAVQRSRTRSRVRAMWEGGGTLALLGSALSTDDLSTLSSRIAAVQHVTRDDRAQLAAAAVAERRADALAAALDRSALQQTALRSRAADALAQARTDVASQHTLLDRAGAEVARLAELQRTADAAHSAATFRARLAAALSTAQAAQRAQAALAAQRAQAELAAQQSRGKGGSRAGSTALLALPAVGTVPASQVGQTVLDAAQGLLGQPYVWGGTGPVGYDCSGLTGAAYAAAGIFLPRTAAQQWLSGPHPALQDMQPGDLLFWASDPNDSSTIHHVALYLGGDMMISTNHTGDVARIQPIWDDEFVGATRPDPLTALEVSGPRWTPGA